MKNAPHNKTFDSIVGFKMRPECHETSIFYLSLWMQTERWLYVMWSNVMAVADEAKLFPFKIGYNLKIVCGIFLKGLNFWLNWLVNIDLLTSPLESKFSIIFHELQILHQTKIKLVIWIRKVGCRLDHGRIFNLNM